MLTRQEQQQLKTALDQMLGIVSRLDDERKAYSKLPFDQVDSAHEDKLKFSHKDAKDALLSVQNLLEEWSV